MTGPLGIRRIREHAEHALIADARDSGEICRLAIDRRLIELEIAGVKNCADRRSQRQRACSRDRVIDVNELGIDRAVAYAAAGLHFSELGFVDPLLA